jgi:hypothetical protein
VCGCGQEGHERLRSWRACGHMHEEGVALHSEAAGGSDVWIVAEVERIEIGQF